MDVVIVNYKSRNYIGQCLDSIKKNVKCDHNIFLVDNDIDKKLWDIQQENIHIINMNKNRGFAYACNQAVLKGNSEFILFINPDAKLISPIEKACLFSKENNAIVCARLFSKKHEPIMSIMNYYSLLGSFLEIRSIKKLLFKKKIDRNEPFQIPSGHFACCIVPRKIFEQLNGFDLSFFLYFEDMDLCYRAFLKNIPTYYVPFFKAVHYERISSEQDPVRSLLYNYKGRYIFIKKHYGKIQFKLLFFWNIFKILMWYVISCFAIICKLRSREYNKKISCLLKYHFSELKELC